MSMLQHDRMSANQGLSGRKGLESARSHNRCVYDLTREEEKNTSSEQRWRQVRPHHPREIIMIVFMGVTGKKSEKRRCTERFLNGKTGDGGLPARLGTRAKIRESRDIESYVLSGD